MGIPSKLSRVTNHKKPLCQLYQPGFNDSNGCWLEGSWVTVPAEGFAARAKAHQAMYSKALGTAKKQNHRDPGVKPEDMTPAQRQAWGHFSGSGRLYVREPNGTVGIVGTELCGGRVSTKSVEWMRKRGSRVIPQVLTPNGPKKLLQDQADGIPADLLSDDKEPVDPWKLIVQENKRRSREMSLAMAKLDVKDMCGVSADSMAVYNVIELEEGILRHETSKQKDDLETIEEAIAEYVECRAEMEKELGDRFQAAYESARASHNSCARANLDNSKGFLASYFLPKFNPDGTHGPVGPRDWPWGRDDCKAPDAATE